MTENRCLVCGARLKGEGTICPTCWVQEREKKGGKAMIQCPWCGIWYDTSKPHLPHTDCERYWRALDKAAEIMSDDVATVQGHVKAEE